MILQACFRADDSAIGIDLRLQCLRPIERLARGDKELDAGSIFDGVLSNYRTPESHAVLAERPRWRAGQRRVVGNEFQIFRH
ncbi:hypothetical protein [Mesorhizobium silamurunense]|nr:hypothetical protein [Mesorhizobium silamurunense]